MRSRLLLSGPVTNPHYWQRLLSFRLGCSKSQINLYESLCHDAIHNYIEEQYIWRVACRESQDNQYCPCSATTKWIRLWGLAWSLAFINDPNITFQKLLCPDLIKCLRSGRMEQFPLLFSHRNIRIEISARLVHVISLEIFLLIEVSHIK